MSDVTDKSVHVDNLDEQVRIAWTNALLLVSEVRSWYPENIFVPPAPGGRSCPDAYAAAGCRLACDNIRSRLEKAKDEHLAAIHEQEQETDE